jgi:hypothetical protein
MAVFRVGFKSLLSAACIPLACLEKLLRLAVTQILVDAFLATKARRCAD